ncbi:MAG: zinc ribbon domain-containing protein [Candidatus Lokiarchaeota archaeon]|jgi:hypothetical protein
MMETRTPTGYCPRCRQAVLLMREEINWGIVFLLLCFTGGIGLIIYLIIHYSKPIYRCVHCNERVLSRIPQNIQPIDVSQNVTSLSSQEDKIQENDDFSPKFCPFCGEKLEAPNVKFCSNCGTKI